jgi:AraC family transcriptional regulator
MNTANPLAVQPDRFEKGETKLITGISRSYTFPNMMGIPAQWMEFGPHFMGGVPNQIGKRAYGVAWNQKEAGFDYLCGVEVSSFEGAPANFAQVTLEPQTYAVFKHQGHVSAIGATHTAIWTQWLPQSGKQPTHKPSFELYLEDFNPLMGMGGIEIWIPVKE